MAEMTVGTEQSVKISLSWKEIEHLLSEKCSREIKNIFDRSRHTCRINFERVATGYIITYTFSEYELVPTSKNWLEGIRVESGIGGTGGSMPSDEETQG